MDDDAVISEAVSVAVRAGASVVLWGSPGSGKTAFLRGLAESLGWPIEVVAASDPRAVEVGVGGQDRSDGGEAGPGLLCFDDLTSAPTPVQAGIQRVLDDRRVGGVPLPSGVRVVAAASPPQQAVDGRPLAPSLANRFVHLDRTPDPGTVAAGLVAGFAAPVVAADGPAADDAQAKAARSVVAQLLHRQPERALAVPADPGAAGRGWPSPRSWERVVTLLAACEALKASVRCRSLLVIGCVGESAGLALLASMANVDLPDARRALADPDGFALPVDKDKAMAVLGAVASMAISRGDPASWSKAARLVARAAKAAPEVASLAARALASDRPAGAEVPRALPPPAPDSPARTDGSPGPPPDPDPTC